MCVIAIKPKGKPMPSDETLWRLWDANPGGAGVMYNLTHCKKVRICKGFMTFTDFIDFVDGLTLGGQIDISDQTVVFHFRRMKNRNPAFTHPFPLDRPDHMLDLACVCHAGIAQNGIIRAVKADFGETRNMTFTRTVLAPMYADEPYFLESWSTRSLLYRTTGCRMAVLYGDGSFHTVGDFAEEEGLILSNTKFLPCPKTQHPLDADFAVGYNHEEGVMEKCPTK